MDREVGRSNGRVGGNKLARSTSLAFILLYLGSCKLAHAGVIDHEHAATSVNREVELTRISRNTQMQETVMAKKIDNDAEKSTQAQNTPNTVKNLENPKIFFPPGIQEMIVPGASLWELSVGSHRDSNAHHNYATYDRAVAQEIALDFFSSALVSCLLVDVPITAGKVKRAYTSIHDWPNYIKGSPVVKESVAFVGRYLFRHFHVADDTEEEAIPSKLYDVVNAKTRDASERLLETWRNITGNQDFGKGTKIKEYHIFFELVSYLKNNVYTECEDAWKLMLPLMLEDTELGKWVKEVDSHKKLVVDFHEYCHVVTGYEVTDAVAEAHDNDKYIPFNLLAYTLKWYYGDVGVLE